MREESPRETSGAKKISTLDAEYKRRHETSKKGPKNFVFGAPFLHEWELHNGNLNSVKIEKQNADLTMAFRELLSDESPEEIRRAAGAYIRRGLTSEFALQTLKNCCYVAGVPFDEDSHALADVLGVKVTQEVIATSVFKRLVRDDVSIPSELWAAIVAGNISAIETLETQLNTEHLPVLTAEFKQNLPDFLAKYNIPLGVTQDLLSRLDTLAVGVVDGLSAAVESTGGRYTHDFNSIEIAASYISGEQKKDLRETVNHEYFHALSGRLVFDTGGPIDLSYEENGSIISIPFNAHSAGRVGLSFQGPFWLNFQGRFGWLNEAVTERLTVELMERQGHPVPDPTYQTEMKILEHLCARGKEPIAFQTFVQAYFENYEPSSGEGKETIPAWRELRAAINRSFDPKFLVAIDTHIQKVGSDKALADLENGGFKLE